jgi:hypothetical protein
LSASPARSCRFSNNGRGFSAFIKTRILILGASEPAASKDEGAVDRAFDPRPLCFETAYVRFANRFARNGTSGFLPLSARARNEVLRPIALQKRAANPWFGVALPAFRDAASGTELGATASIPPVRLDE